MFRVLTRKKSRPRCVAGSELAALRALLKYVAVAAQRGTNRGNAATAYSKWGSAQPSRKVTHKKKRNASGFHFPE